MSISAFQHFERKRLNDFGVGERRVLGMNDFDGIQQSEDLNLDQFFREILSDQSHPFYDLVTDNRCNTAEVLEFLSNKKYLPDQFNANYVIGNLRGGLWKLGIKDALNTGNVNFTEWNKGTMSESENQGVSTGNDNSFKDYATLGSATLRDIQNQLEKQETQKQLKDYKIEATLNQNGDIIGSGNIAEIAMKFYTFLSSEKESRKLEKIKNSFFLVSQLCKGINTKYKISLQKLNGEYNYALVNIKVPNEKKDELLEKITTLTDDIILMNISFFLDGYDYGNDDDYPRKQNIKFENTNYWNSCN